MTREEEKIKAAKEYGTENPIFIRDEYGAVGFDEIRSAADFAKGIEWADSHPVNQWHKVEDELPPSEPHLTGWSVMVWATDGTHYEPCKYDSVDRRWVSVYGFNSKMNEVSYWMLLPQLSEEE